MVFRCPQFLWFGLEVSKKTTSILQTSLQEKAVCSHRHVIFITTYCDYLQRWCHKIWYILVNFPFIPFIPFIPLTQPWIFCFFKKTLLFGGVPLVKNPFKLQQPQRPREWVFVKPPGATPGSLGSRGLGLASLSRRRSLRRVVVPSSFRRDSSASRDSWVRDPWGLGSSGYSTRSNSTASRSLGSWKRARTGQINGDDDCLSGFCSVLLCFFGWFLVPFL